MFKKKLIFFRIEYLKMYFQVATSSSTIPTWPGTGGAGILSSTKLTTCPTGPEMPRSLTIPEDHLTQPLPQLRLNPPEK